MKRLSAILIIFFTLIALSFKPVENTRELHQQEVKTAVNWLSWEEAMALSQKDKKKILLSVYTDWCGWCKRMDTVTFEEPGLARYLNENFYPVKFDAEQRTELEYKGKS